MAATVVAANDLNHQTCQTCPTMLHPCYIHVDFVALHSVAESVERWKDIGQIYLAATGDVDGLEDRNRSGTVGQVGQVGQLCQPHPTT